MVQSTESQAPLRVAVPHLRRFPLRISQRKFLLASVDIALLNGALLLLLHRSLRMPLSVATILSHPLWFATLTVLWLVIASSGDCYDLKRATLPSVSAFGIVKAMTLTTIIYAFVPLLSPPLLRTRSPVLFVGVIAFGALILWRVAYAVILVQPNFRRRAIVVGAGWAGRTIVQAIQERDPGHEIIGYIDDDEAKHNHSFEGVTVLGGWNSLTRLAREHDASDIVLAITHEMHPDLVRAILMCLEQGARVVPMPELYEQLTGRIPVQHIGDRWLVSLPIDQDPRGLYPVVKRVMDIGIASVGLLVLAPFFPFLALAIKLDSPGPIFYRPKRLGKAGHPFRPWKFRTMVSDADRIGDPTFTKKNDSRITHVGRILRASHIDEFPQFINILKGEMSTVGPRPERQVLDFEEIIPFYRTRCVVKPGMAGWGLVNQGYADGLEDTLVKLQYDLYYIKHQSLSLDVLILVKTVFDMIARMGR